MGAAKAEGEKVEERAEAVQVEVDLAEVARGPAKVAPRALVKVRRMQSLYQDSQTTVCRPPKPMVLVVERLLPFRLAKYFLAAAKEAAPEGTSSEPEPTAVATLAYRVSAESLV